MVRKSRPLWTLESRGRDRTGKYEPWWLVHSAFQVTKVREVQAALTENWVEAHDFRIRRWERS